MFVLLGLWSFVVVFVFIIVAVDMNFFIDAAMAAVADFTEGAGLDFDAGFRVEAGCDAGFTVLLVLPLVWLWFSLLLLIFVTVSVVLFSIFT